MKLSSQLRSPNPKKLLARKHLRNQSMNQNTLFSKPLKVTSKPIAVSDSFEPTLASPVSPQIKRINLSKLKRENLYEEPERNPTSLRNSHINFENFCSKSRQSLGLNRFASTSRRNKASTKVTNTSEGRNFSTSEGVQKAVFSSQPRLHQGKEIFDV